MQKFFMKMFEPASNGSIQSLLDIKNEEDHEETDFLLPLMPPGYQPGTPAGEVRALRLGERVDFPLARPVVAGSNRRRIIAGSRSVNAGCARIGSALMTPFVVVPRQTLNAVLSMLQSLRTPLPQPLKPVASQATFPC